MTLARRELLVAGIVVACIATGLLFATFVFGFVRFYKQIRRKREAARVRTNSKRKCSLGK